MSVLKIFTFPDKVLLKHADPVAKFDAALKNLASDMFDTMKAENGIGLAAPQVGASIRLIVVDIEATEDEPRHRFAVCNPVIAQKKGHARIEEGCLSLPDFFVEVDRAKEIVLSGQAVDGSPIEVKADGLLAICFQHEIDHLDGTLLVNYVEAYEREAYRKEMKTRKKKPGPLKI